MASENGWCSRMEETLPEGKAAHQPGILTGRYEEGIKKEPTPVSLILSDIKMSRFSNLLEQIGLEKALEAAQVIKNDIEVINRFEETISDPDSLELQQIHPLLEENMWLIDDHYRNYSSNKSLQTILENEMLKKYKKYKNKRPDIVCKSNYHDYIVIELKKPKHRISPKDYAQLAVYLSVIEAHCPNSKLIEGYLVGLKFDGAVRSHSRKGGRIHLLSYNEILSDVRFRYRRQLEIFNWRGSIDK